MFFSFNFSEVPKVFGLQGCFCKSALINLDSLDAFSPQPLLQITAPIKTNRMFQEADLWTAGQL